MKRKLTLALILAALLVMGLALTVMAQGSDLAYGSQDGAQTCPTGDFVDADGDGVCDNMGAAAGLGQGQRRANADAASYGGRHGMMSEAQGNVQAMRGSMGGRNMTAQGFADTDGDGVCDHSADGNNGQCDGCGAGVGGSGMQQRTGGMQHGMQGHGRGAGANR